MSVATQIQRLKNIKSAIRLALVSKGIDAEHHNMEDFAADIDPLTDVRDTTATAQDVINGRFFYDAEGVKMEGIMPFRANKGSRKFNPFREDINYRSIQYPSGYYPDEHGAWVEYIEMLDAAPSEEGTPLEAWKVYQTIGGGYFYNQKQEIHFGEVYTKGTNTVEFPEGYDSVYFVYGAQNSGTITFSDCDFEEIMVEGGSYQGWLKIYKLIKTSSNTFTVSITIGGAYNCHWTIIY